MKIRLVTCTKYGVKKFETTPIAKSINKHLAIGNIDDTHIFYENTKGLSECYNHALEKYKKESLIFIHDDVYLTDIFLREKLLKAFNDYDVVGVAGSSDFSLNREYVGWHISPRESWSGSVEHPYKNGTEGLTYWTFFGTTPSQVAIIDGLFIAVNNVKTKFDEDFKFHGYDTAFCLRCIQDNYKIGVINIHMTHLSHGEGIRTQEYREVETLLKHKYGK